MFALDKIMCLFVHIYNLIWPGAKKKIAIATQSNYLHTFISEVLLPALSSGEVLPLWRMHPRAGSAWTSCWETHLSSATICSMPTRWDTQQCRCRDSVAPWWGMLQSRELGRTREHIWTGCLGRLRVSCPSQAPVCTMLNQTTMRSDSLSAVCSLSDSQGQESSTPLQVGKGKKSLIGRKWVQRWTLQSTFWAQQQRHW